MSAISCPPVTLLSPTCLLSLLLASLLFPKKLMGRVREKGVGERRGKEVRYLLPQFWHLQAHSKLMVFSSPRQTGKPNTNTAQHICDTTNRKQSSEYTGMIQHVDCDTHWLWCSVQSSPLPCPLLPRPFFSDWAGLSRSFACMD